MLSGSDKPSDVWDTHGISGKRFCKSTGVFFITLPRRIQSLDFQRVGTHITACDDWKPNTRHSFGSEMPVTTVSQKFSHPLWWRPFKELWSRPTKTADFGSSLWQVPYASDTCLLEDKVQDRGMYLFEISYGSDAMDKKKWRWLIQWMNWDLRHLLVVFQCRILMYLMPGLLQHWNKIIHNSQFKRRISPGGNKRPRSRTVSFAEDRLPTWSTTTSGSLEPMILSKNYTDLFTISLRNDGVREFDSMWNGILLSMTKIPHDDILDGLYKLRIRESEKTKDRIGIVWPGDSSEESWSWFSVIEDNGKKKYRAEFTNEEFLEPEAEIMRETPWSRIRGQKQREQRSLGDCWQWEAIGGVLPKETIVLSVTMSINVQNIDKAESFSEIFYAAECEKCNVNQKSLEAEALVGKMARLSCKHNLNGTCTIHSVKNGFLQSACSTSQKKDADLAKSALMHTARLMNSPSKKSKNGDNGAVAILKITRQLGLRISRYGATEVFIDFAEELKHTEANPMCSIH